MTTEVSATRWGTRRERAGGRLSSLTSSDLPGARSTVSVGAWLVAGTFAVLVIAGATSSQGGAVRVATVVICVLGCVGSAQVARAVTHASARQVRWFLVWVCLAPLVSSLVYLGWTRQLEQTALVMLVVIAIGAVGVNRRDLFMQALLSYLGWVAVVWLLAPRPVDQVEHYAVQLGLACVLSLSIFEVRHRVLSRLSDAQAHITAQRDELMVVSAQAAHNLARLQGLISASPVGLAVSDERGRLIEVNPAFCTLTGRAPSELVGQSASLFTHADDVALTARSGELISTSRYGFVRLENRFVRPDAQTLWVCLTLSHVTGPAGETWTLAHVEDISERKLAEEGLRRSHEVIEATRLVAHAAAMAQDPRDVVLSQTRLITEASSVQFIERHDPDHLMLVRCQGRPDLTGTRIDLRQRSVTRHVWESGETVFVDEVHEHPLVDRTLLVRSDARSLMWEPVKADGEVVAIISIAWSTRRDEVTTLQRDAVKTIAAEAAVALLSERVRTSLVEWSTTDPLTGLLNRRGWDSQVEALEETRRREGGFTVVALFDLDHFKAYNDAFGHDAGDAALSTFGQSLSVTRRTGDIVARWGGEEFIVALPQCGADAARAALERLRRCVPAGLTSSVGYAVVDVDEPIREAVGRADRALYLAKDRGRDQICGGTGYESPRTAPV